MKGWIRVKRTAPTTPGGILTRDESQKLAGVQEWLGHANIATTRLYGYCTGVMSARRLARAVEEQIPYRYLSGNLQPEFWTLADFRKDHLQERQGLFVEFGQVL
jgi:Transposase domain (DUF772)